MQKDESISRNRRVVGAGLVYFISLALLGSATAKLARVPKVVAELGAMGFTDHRLLLIAILEIVSAVLFAVRPTRAIGVLLVSAFLGGAIATHVQHGESGAQPALVLTLLLLGAWLRDPKILWSLNRHSPDEGDAHGHVR